MNQIDAMLELARFHRLRERLNIEKLHEEIVGLKKQIKQLELLQCAKKELFGTKEYKERNHGITRESIKYLARHINSIGMIICVEGRRYDTEEEGDKGRQEDYWTTFSDKDGNKIVCSGFAWGYYGEGPSGLQKTLLALHWDYSSLDVANFPDSFKITG